MAGCARHGGCRHMLAVYCSSNTALRARTFSHRPTNEALGEVNDGAEIWLGHDLPRGAGAVSGWVGMRWFEKQTDAGRVKLL